MSRASHPAPYWPALDGVRAVAVLLVVAYHLDPVAVQRGGSIGVTMFFTLSGFLITTLLLDESDRTGTVSLARFYARRALRLLPALVVLVPVVTAYAAWSDRGDDTVRAAPAVLLYAGNWVRALTGFDTLGMFEHAWSLAVEEQFYLVWPLVVIAAAAVAGRHRRAEAVLVTALLGSLASLWWRLSLWDDGDPPGSAARLYNGTDTVADQLLIGGALAAAVVLVRRHRADRPPAALSGAVLQVLGPLALGFLVWVAVERPGGPSVGNNRLYLTWGASAFALAAAIVVLMAVAARGALLSRVLSLWPLVAVGKVSYGLYLWHYPVILMVQAEMEGSSVAMQRAVALAITAAVTGASWVLVERPALARKRRFHAPDGPAPDAGAAAPAVERGQPVASRR